MGLSGNKAQGLPAESSGASATPSGYCVAHSRLSHASLPISPARPIRNQTWSRVSAKGASALNKLRWRHTPIFLGPIIAAAAQKDAEKFEQPTWFSFLPGASASGAGSPVFTERSLQREAMSGGCSGSCSVWIMAIIWTLTVLWAGVQGMEGRCLPGGKHKASPSPEGQLGVCQLYVKNACCSPEVVQDLSKANDIYWNRCGSLSSRCEEYLQHLECFYRCSPIAAQWPHPQRPTAVLAVPLCQSFCDQWYDACKEDLTCARNWLTDWHWGPDGNNCSQDCLPYGQVYKDGKELCETIWDDSFTVSADPCDCLTLTLSSPAFPTSDDQPENDDSMEEPDTTKEGSKRDGRRSPEGPCTGNLLLQRLRRNMQKRSVFMEDVEGSGSGF